MAGDEQGNDLLADLDVFLAEHEAELIEFRRDLHMHPELAFNEHRTTRRVALRDGDREDQSQGRALR